MPDWRQYKLAFRPTIEEGCLRAEEVAWLNLATVAGDWDELREVRRHSICAHLQPMLELLAPRFIIARYGRVAEELEKHCDYRCEVVPIRDKFRARPDDIRRARKRMSALRLCRRGRVRTA